MANSVEKQTFGLNLQITKKCNFSCSYCYESGQHKDLSLSELAIPDIIRLAKEINASTDKKMALTFIGGEPTLNAQFATLLLNQLLDLDLLASVALITNGWEKEIIENFFGRVPKELIRIQVSYDGKDINDRFRLKGSQKTTTRVLDNYRSLLESGFRVDLKSTIPIDALHTVPEILAEFQDYEKEFNTNITYACTEDFTTTFNKDRSFDDFKKYLGDSFEAILKFELARLKKNLAPISRWFKEMDFNGARDCNAGIDFFTINEEGSIQYCHHVDYTKGALDLNYINVSDPRAWDKMQEIKERNITRRGLQANECSGCPAIYCIKCPILNFAITKDKEAMHGKHAVPFMCDYYIEISKYLYIYDKIRRQNEL